MRKLHLLDPAAPQGCLTRRKALEMLAASALVGCYSNTVVVEHVPPPDAGSPPPSDAADESASCMPAGETVGPVTEFPVGTWKEVGTLIIGQDAKGFFAFTAICTHAGCVVDPPAKNGATFCSCHGSRFDGNGNVTAGPAFSPLEHYALEVCNGNVVVDTSKVVAATTRTPAA